MLKILEIHFGKLQRRMEDKGIKMELSDTAKKHISKEGFSPEFGARPLIREIKSQLSQPLSTMIIKGEVNTGDSLFVDFQDGEMKWNVTKEKE